MPQLVLNSLYTDSTRSSAHGLLTVGWMLAVQAAAGSYCLRGQLRAVQKLVYVNLQARQDHQQLPDILRFVGHPACPSHRSYFSVCRRFDSGTSAQLTDARLGRLPAAHYGKRASGDCKAGGCAASESDETR